MMKRMLFLLLSLLMLCTGCSETTPPEEEQETVQTEESAEPAETQSVEEEEQEVPVVESETTEEPATPEQDGTIGSEVTTEESVVEESEEAENGYVVAIDAGHQGAGNPELEPIAPGATETKAKVTSGTTGCTTGIPEYELTLALCLMLQEELESRGYTVVMTRTTHDVDISNSERATVANEAEADAFLRIHANGSEDSTVSGAMTICQTSSNSYNSALYEASYALSEAVLDELVAATGCNRQYIWETDTMSGINWCQVPVTIVEVGYMSNPEEDALLATEEYRANVVEGIANGVDVYFGLS